MSSYSIVANIMYLFHVLCSRLIRSNSRMKLVGSCEFMLNRVI
jgi:hypothetical protein